MTSVQVKPFSFFSTALYSRKTCHVILPPDYEAAPEKRYLVLYLLHGMRGTEVSWMNNGRAHETVTRAMLDGDLQPCIVVMPNDGEYGQGTFYVDWYDGTGNFEQYFVYDLVPAIDREFRTLTGREHRVIGGYSMGGFGAFSLSLRHPELFGAASSLSGGLGVLSTLPHNEFVRSEFPRMVGPLAGPYARAHDLVMLAEQRLGETVRPELYFDCGTEDYLYPLNAAYHKKLNELGYLHEYQEFSGEHNWAYWTEHLSDSLAFFHRYWAGGGAAVDC
ncbi:alpha/beta hydrolase [Paenibacillus koleovorans]|uniref:alpha/beta hydrolase n=1 Tax=Paenibacillus koleovorans TaxID=121608 RepID=UPI000FDB8F1B|nr:alpha/beta hydrolase family protein [Paenibacillus koleovorans]